MNKLQSLLRKKAILIADGAWGTELNRCGLTAGECPELWNVEHADDVRAVAAAYVEAGADVILTNTFGGNRFKFAKFDLGDRVSELNQRGAELSKEAAGKDVLVLASVGPTGEFIEPLGSVSADEMEKCFAEQITALLAGGADGVVIETMSDLSETVAALGAARGCGAEIAVVSMTFQQGPKGFATMMGITPARAAEQLTAAGADAIGANCGAGIVQMTEVISQMRVATDKPLWAKANAGLPELVNGETIFRQTPQEMAARLPELAAAGANIIGGCCGTTPDHIRDLANAAAELG